MKKSRRLKLTSVAVSLIMLVSLISPHTVGAAAKTAEEYQQEIEQYEAELSELKSQQATESEYQSTLTKQIDSLNSQMEIYQTEVDTLSTQVTAKETEISGLNDEILTLEADIDAKNEEISAKEDEKLETIEQLKERMRQDYISGQTSTMDLLLSSTDFGEFMSSIEYIKRIAVHDQDLADLLIQQIEEIETAKQEVEQDVVELTAQKSEMETALADLQTQQDEMNAAKANLESTSSSLQTKLNESKQESSKISESAKTAQENLEEAKEGYDDATAAIKEAIENNKNNGGSSSSGSGSSSGGGSSSSSGWGWPISTTYKITSGYGPRNLGSGYHYGVDFASPAGTSIYASKGGTVIVSTYGVTGSGFGGYGNVVVVDHGNGYVTLYAHMSSRAVSVGQSVSQGQTLGYVGTTGNSTGNHLHFEVRDSSANRLNPTGFIGTSP